MTLPLVARRTSTIEAPSLWRTHYGPVDRIHGNGSLCVRRRDRPGPTRSIVDPSRFPCRTHAGWPMDSQSLAGPRPAAGTVPHPNRCAHRRGDLASGTLAAAIAVTVSH